MFYRLRRRLRGPYPVLAGSASMLAVAAGAFFLLGSDMPATEPPPTTVQPVPTSAIEKDEARMPAAAAGEMRAQAGSDLGSLPAFTVAPPLRSIDGTGFLHEGETVRLSGVVGPGAGDVCLDETGRWSCGLQARAALHNLIAGSALTCQPQRALTEGGVSAQCRLPERAGEPEADLARQLVRAGWARPAPGQDAAFPAEENEARSQKAGLWRGGWRIARH